MRALFLVLLLAACAKPAPPSPPVSSCVEQRFEQAGFIVCAAPRGRIEIRSGMRSFAALQTRLGRRTNSIAFAVNGGMFDDAGAPIGLMIEDQREVQRINRREGGGNFHLMPNGVFLVRTNDRAEVVTGEAFKPAPT